MENQQVLNYKYKRGVTEVYPAHKLVSNWVFPEDETEEAALAHYMAIVAEKNGLTKNDLQNLFPAVLRMLKSESVWAK